MRQVLSILFILGVFLITCTSYAGAKPNYKYASLVMDADTGIIISQRYADKKLHPASLTKMMTLLMVFEALDRGDLKKNSRIYVSKRAASMVPSKLYLKPGQYIRTEDAIYSLVTKSANDVAVAVAEKIGGTESKFAQMMTNRARTIGMTSTRFMNASGLHNRSQISTARDMATLARYMLQRYPHYYRYFSTQNFNYKGKSYRNHNRLMKTYKGMDGFKTGYINASGFNLVASAKQNNRRLIGVVFGGRSSKTRNAHMKEILDIGFRKVKTLRTAHIKNPPIPLPKPGSEVSLAAAPEPSQPKVGMQYASVSALAARGNYNQKPKETTLTRALKNQQFGIIEQGSVEPAHYKQAQKKSPQSIGKPERVVVQPTVPDEWDSQRQRISKAPISSSHQTNGGEKWGIQIGAFQDRVKTDEALRQAMKTLPTTLSIHASPISVPMDTTSGTIFRARLGGLSQQQAAEACTYFKDCMTVSPHSISLSNP